MRIFAVGDVVRVVHERKYWFNMMVNLAHCEPYIITKVEPHTMGRDIALHSQMVYYTDAHGHEGNASGYWFDESVSIRDGR